MGQQYRRPTADDFEFPDDATPQEINAFLLKQPPIKVTAPPAETPEAPQGSAVSRFTKNAAEMLNPIEIVKGLGQMVRHPLDTYESMVDQSANQFIKANEAYERGGLSEAVGHGAAGVLPMIGPLAAEAGEQIGAGDVAGGLGKAAGILAGPKALKELVKVPARIPATRAMLERGAAARVADVMSPKASNQVARRMGAKAEKIAPEILKENRGGWSRAALQKQILGKLADAEQGLDAATDARLEARAIDTRPILDALNDSRGRLTSKAIVGSRAMPVIEDVGQGVPPPSNLHTPSLTKPSFSQPSFSEPVPAPAQKVKTAAPIGEDVVPAPNKPRVSQIDQAIDELKRLGPVSQYEPLRVMRQAYDGPAKTVYNPSLVDDFLKKSGEAKGAADVTAALRETLAKADPATAEANARYALYKSASDILEAAEQIEKAKPKTGRQIMARLTATMFGGQTAGVAGAAAGYTLAPAMDSLVNAGFTTKLKTAQLMQALADATKTGDVGRVQSLSYRLMRSAAKARVPGVAVSRQTELAGQE